MRKDQARRKIYGSSETGSERSPRPRPPHHHHHSRMHTQHTPAASMTTASSCTPCPHAPPHWSDRRPAHPLFAAPPQNRTPTHPAFSGPPSSGRPPWQNWYLPPCHSHTNERRKRQSCGHAPPDSPRNKGLRKTDRGRHRHPTNPID